MICKYYNNEMELTNEVNNGWQSYRDYTCKCGSKCTESVFEEDAWTPPERKE